MIGIVVIIASVTIMVKVAESEERSPVLWGIITAVLCVLCGVLIPLPLINIVIGLVVSYMIMFVTKLLRKE